MTLSQKLLLKRFLLTSTSLICLSSVLEASFREAELPSKRESTRPQGVRLGQRREPGLFETQAAFKKNLLTSIQAREDQLTPLLQILRPLLKALPPESLKIIREHFKELLDNTRSLLPHTFLHSTVVIRTQPGLTPDHYEFDRLNDVLQSLSHLSAEPSLKSVSGLLKQLHDYYQQYQQALCNKASGERSALLSAITVKSDLFENPLLISKEMVYRLLSMDEYGIITKRNKTGSSPNIELEGTYFKKALFLEREGKKFATLDPSMEWAIGAFHNRLFGEGVAPSAFLVFPRVPYKHPAKEAKEAHLLLAKINDPAQSPKRMRRIEKLHENEGLKKQFIDTTAPYSAQASPTITGSLLKDFLLEAQQDPSLFATLDKGQVQGLLLSLLLTNPNDAKGDNFIVTNGDKNRKIISIDNDLSLAARIVTVQAPNDGPLLHFPEVRNLLFMVPEFIEQPLLPAVRAHFLSQEPTLFLLQWLRALEEQNRRYQAFETDLGEKTFTLFRLPFQFQAGTLKRLYQDWTHLRQSLHTKPETSLQGLLESLSPLLGSYYKSLRSMGSDYLRNFDRLYPVPQRSFEELLDLEYVLPNGVSIKEALDAEQAQEEGFKHRTQPIKEAVAELFEVFDPISLKPAALKSVLEELRLTFPEALEAVFLRLPLSNLLSATPSKEVLDTFFMLFPERLHEIEEGTSFSPLHHALEMNNTKLIAYLLKKGASPDQRTKDHRFSLDLACEQGAQEAFKLLIDAGASKVNADKALTFYHKLAPNSTVVPAFIKLARRQQELHWLLSIQTLLPEKGEGVSVETASFGHRVMPQTLYDQLFTVKGSVKAENISGRHAVGRLSVALINLPLTLYFKAYPELPGLEEAVGEFTRRLLGFGTPYAELIKVGDIPVLMSQGIQGPTLAHILKEAPQILNHLDADALSSLYLATMLVNPEDGKADNYIVETMPNGKARLIAIDNDHAFVPAVARQQKKSFLKAEPVVQVKSILYCLDAFQAPVSAAAREQLLSVNAGKMLEDWLRLLRARNSLYSDLFDEKERLSLLKQDSYIGIPFQEGAITHLYQKIRRMQEVLQQDPTITHERLLKLLEPELAHRYGKGFEKPATVLERFQVIDGPFYGKGSTGEPYTFTKSGHILKALNIPLKESLIQVASKDSAQTHDYRPNKALQELKEILSQHQQAAFNKMGVLNSQQLRTMPNKEFSYALSQQDFASVSLGDQRVLFDLLKGRRVEELILKNATALTNKMVLTYPPLQELVSINLSGCVNLTNKILLPLAGYAPHLTYLNLSNLPKLTQIGKISLFNTTASSFPSLQTLILNGSGIRGIYLDAEQYSNLYLKVPHLQRLEAQGCKKLRTLQIKGSQLETLLLNNSSQVNAEELIEVIINHTALQHLGIESGPQIYFDSALQIPVPKKGLSNTAEFKQVQAYYKDAVLNNSPQAQFNLGWMYDNGNGVKKDDTLAVEWYTKAANQGNAASQGNLAWMCSNGKGIEKNEKLAVAWYIKAANQGNDIAQCNLGSMYKDGRGIEKDEKLAVAWYAKAADQGNAPAQFNLGWMYANGRGVEKDDTLALEWYKKAAEQGNAPAQFNLGWMYANGRGVEKDDTLALEWYKKAAEQGNAAAQFNLGMMYEKGNGVEKDAKLAVEWYTKAANQGDAAAQFNLGSIYQNGGRGTIKYASLKHAIERGKVNKDGKLAVAWYAKAADQGNAPAQCNLGWMYENGRGIEQDEKLAFMYYERAMKQGISVSYCALGNLYYYGKGVLRNKDKAQDYFQEVINKFREESKHSIEGYDHRAVGIAYYFQEDFKRAFVRFQFGAEKGDLGSQIWLGRFYKEGLQTQQDLKLAVELFEKAAKQDYSAAYYHLGLLFLGGEGVSQDKVKAFSLFQEAANQQDGQAQYMFGWMYKEGVSIDQDLQKADHWFAESKKRYPDEALYSLGRLYEYGLGVQKDQELALSYYRQAAELNNILAKRRLAALGAD